MANSKNEVKLGPILNNGKMSFELLLSLVGEEIHSQLMGRILTIIDAAVPPSAQQTALKDLIRQEIYAADTNAWRYMNNFAEDNEIKTDIKFASGN